ncbi:hypothetical protein ACFW9D_05850 [Streptomyces sp. NPDC059524]|uniref:hypothetical protein n=1 Tax=Streptomyces sp. NPDC059524 TaxID=3346856 RepID=UPI00369F362D
MDNEEFTLERQTYVARVAAHAIAFGHTDQITDKGIALAADHADLDRPESHEVREAIRAALTTPLNDDDTGQAFAEAVMQSAVDGHPFRYTAGDGTTILLLPVIDEAEDA